MILRHDNTITRSEKRNGNQAYQAPVLYAAAKAVDLTQGSIMHEAYYDQCGGYTNWVKPNQHC